MTTKKQDNTTFNFYVTGNVEFSSLAHDRKYTKGKNDFSIRSITLSGISILGDLEPEQKAKVEKYIEDNTYIDDETNKSSVSFKSKGFLIKKYTDLNTGDQVELATGDDEKPRELASGQDITLALHYGKNEDFDKEYVSVNGIAFALDPVYYEQGNPFADLLGK